jgi:two-component system sensor histidine kinase/response regulator
MTLGIGSPVSTIDFRDLLNRVDGDQELVCELFNIFKEEVPTLLSAIQESVIQGDLRQVSRSAHTLRGMLGNLSMRTAQAAAARLEQVSAEARYSDTRDAIVVLEKELLQVILEVDAYLLNI